MQTSVVTVWLTRNKLFCVLFPEVVPPRGAIKGNSTNAGQTQKQTDECGRPLFVSSGCRNASPHREEFIYRIYDSPEGVEAAQHRKHVLDGVCNGGQLEREMEERGEKS